jgi:L-amino acid N-acyltransferase
MRPGADPPTSVGRPGTRSRTPTFRSARTEDVPALAAIYNEAVLTTVATFDTEPRSLPVQREWLLHHGPSHPVLVAELDEEVVGWASLSPWSDRRAYDSTAEVSFYVRSDHRGRGIGRALLVSLVEGADARGMHALLARIADGNEVSVHLHEAVGFRRIGIMEQVGFKFGRWVDVHVLERIAP